LIGVSNVDGRVDLAFYEHVLRDDLNAVAPRVLAVARPLKLTVENLDAPLALDAPLWPHDVTPPEGAPLSRPLSLGREVWIERDDFAETPPKGWKRLSPGAEVRLRHGPVVRCTGVDRDASGEIVGLRAMADLATLGAEPEGRRVAGVVHWVSAATAVPARFHLYDRLFTEAVPEAAEDVTTVLNPDSLVETDGFVEPGLAAGTRYQFERLGFFWADPVDSTPEAPVFNRIVALRDSWAKQQAAPTSATKKTEAPRQAVGPRDPASGLTEAQRAGFDALVGRGVGAEEAAVLAADADLGALFERVVGAGVSVRDAAVLLIQDLRPALAGRPASTSQASPEALAAVVGLVAAGTVTKAGGRQAVAALVAEGGQAMETVERLGLAAVRDDAALVPAVDAALAEHADRVEAYRGGEAKVLGFLTGQAMRRAPKGADPKRVQELLRERLGA
ncbi:MAG TPA: hypothetical protein VF576_02100, partial [Rubricoccaceae bacterium]